jgi:peptidoglycan/LPS O-acetylase OafA/YrhL
VHVVPRLSDPALRLPILDGLRGAGLFLVMLVHFRTLEDPQPGAWLEQIWHLGVDLAFVSLDVFFVLSGFLITRILVADRGSAGFFTRFYARRALRILPMYYGFLLAYFVLLPATAAWASQLTLTPWQHVFYWTHSTNVAAGLNDWLNPSNARTGYPFHHSTTHLWSLALEEQFYFLWPVLVHLLSTRALRHASIAVLIVAPLVRVLLVLTLGAESNAAYVLTPARIDGLALGSLMAVWAKEYSGLPVTRTQLAAAIGLTVSVIVAIFLREGHLNGAESAVFQTVGLTASVYLGGALVAASIVAGAHGWWRRLFASRPLVKLGEVSYGTYIVHLPLMFVLDWSGVLSHPADNSGLFTEFRYSGTLIVLSIACGTLTWHLYEKPWLRLAPRRPSTRS